MTQTITPSLKYIYRYPVKGFPGQKLEDTNLVKGAGIPNDRRYAVTKGTIDTGEWMPSRSFFINARVDGMSKFKTNFDGETVRLENIEGSKINFELNNPKSIKQANTKINDFMQPVILEQETPSPQIIDRGKGSLWDYSDTPISIINAESVKALDAKLGTTLDPSRFRGNLIIENLPAWDEFGWMGKRIQFGETILDVHRPIDRCPTPGVNPETGERDVEVTPGLRDHFGHIYCGMYANVIKGGKIKQGDEIKVIGDAEIKLEDTFVSNASNYALWPQIVQVTACEIAEDKATLTLQRTSPWPLPQSTPGQRLKIHLGKDGWSQHHITQSTSDEVTITVEKTTHDDPVTKLLNRRFTIDNSILISGPYGRF